MADQNEILFKLLRKLDSNSSLKGKPHSQKLETELESAKQLSILTDALTKPFAVLRSFGNHPMIFTKVRYGNTEVFYRRFDYKMVSWLTLYSFLAQITYVGGFALLGYRLFHGDYQVSTIPGSGRKTKHAPTFSDILIKVFVTTFFLACCAGAITSFLRSFQLTHFLNSWKDWVFKFVEVFLDVPVNFCKLKCYTYRSMIAATILGSAYFGLGLLFYSPCIFNETGKCSRLDREHSFMFFGFGSSTVLNTTFEHVKFYLLVSLIDSIFSQIEKAVAKTKERFTNDEFALHELFCLVYKVRSQTRLLMKISGHSQIFILFFLFSLTIIIWLLVMQLNAGDVDMSVVALIVTISTMQYVRFFIMSFMCERVEQSEKRVTNTVSQIQPTSLKGQIELQTFINVLTTKPSEFRLDNVITLKRALFLGLLSNSTTYLIAILQLMDVSNVPTLQQAFLPNNTILESAGLYPPST